MTDDSAQEGEHLTARRAHRGPSREWFPEWGQVRPSLSTFQTATVYDELFSTEPAFGRTQSSIDCPVDQAQGGPQRDRAAGTCLGF